MSVIKQIKQYTNGSWKEFKLGFDNFDNVVTLDEDQILTGRKTFVEEVIETEIGAGEIFLRDPSLSSATNIYPDNINFDNQDTGYTTRFDINGIYWTDSEGLRNIYLGEYGIEGDTKNSIDSYSQEIFLYFPDYLEDGRSSFDFSEHLRIPGSIKVWETKDDINDNNSTAIEYGFEKISQTCYNEDGDEPFTYHYSFDEVGGILATQKWFNESDHKLVGTFEFVDDIDDINSIYNLILKNNYLKFLKRGVEDAILQIDMSIDRPELYLAQRTEMGHGEELVALRPGQIEVGSTLDEKDIAYTLIDPNWIECYDQETENTMILTTFGLSTNQGTLSFPSSEKEFFGFHQKVKASLELSVYEDPADMDKENMSYIAYTFEGIRTSTYNPDGDAIIRHYSFDTSASGTIATQEWLQNSNKTINGDTNFNGDINLTGGLINLSEDIYIDGSEIYHNGEYVGDFNSNSPYALANQYWVKSLITGQVKYLGIVNSTDDIVNAFIPQDSSFMNKEGDFVRAGSSFKIETETVHPGDIIIANNVLPVVTLDNYDIIHTEDSGNYVTLTTDQEISGEKTFNNSENYYKGKNLIITNETSATAQIHMQNTDDGPKGELIFSDAGKGLSFSTDGIMTRGSHNLYTFFDDAENNGGIVATREWVLNDWSTDMVLVHTDEITVADKVCIENIGSQLAFRHQGENTTEWFIDLSLYTVADENNGVIGVLQYQNALKFISKYGDEGMGSLRLDDQGITISGNTYYNNGTLNLTNSTIEIDGTVGVAGQILTSTGSGLEWKDLNIDTKNLVTLDEIQTISGQKTFTDSILCQNNIVVGNNDVTEYPNGGSLLSSSGFYIGDVSTDFTVYSNHYIEYSKGEDTLLIYFPEVTGSATFAITSDIPNIYTTEVGTTSTTKHLRIYTDDNGYLHIKTS